MHFSSLLLLFLLKSRVYCTRHIVVQETGLHPACIALISQGVARSVSLLDICHACPYSRVACQRSPRHRCGSINSRWHARHARLTMLFEASCLSDRFNFKPRLENVKCCFYWEKMKHGTGISYLVYSYILIKWMIGKLWGYFLFSLGYCGTPPKCYACANQTVYISQSHLFH